MIRKCRRFAVRDYPRGCCPRKRVRSLVQFEEMARVYDTEQRMQGLVVSLHGGDDGDSVTNAVPLQTCLLEALDLQESGNLLKAKDHESTKLSSKGVQSKAKVYPPRTGISAVRSFPKGVGRTTPQVITKVPPESESIALKTIDLDHKITSQGNTLDERKDEANRTGRGQDNTIEANCHDMFQSDSEFLKARNGKLCKPEPEESLDGNMAVRSHEKNQLQIKEVLADKVIMQALMASPKFWTGCPARTCQANQESVAFKTNDSGHRILKPQNTLDEKKGEATWNKKGQGNSIRTNEHAMFQSDSECLKPMNEKQRKVDREESLKGNLSALHPSNNLSQQKEVPINGVTVQPSMASRKLPKGSQPPMHQDSIKVDLESVALQINLGHGIPNPPNTLYRNKEQASMTREGQKGAVRTNSHKIFKSGSECLKSNDEKQCKVDGEERLKRNFSDHRHNVNQPQPREVPAHGMLVLALMAALGGKGKG